MGASYSTEIPVATERQKERVGVFSLRTKQKQSLVVVEDLIGLLMDDKNVNSLMSLFTLGSDSIKCTDMFIVLSSTLKKEFQLFKFPDPVRPSDISDVAFLPRSVYDGKYKNDINRNRLCENIAWFMVRFTTLIFALAASLKIPQTLNFDISEPSLFIPKIANAKLEFNFDLIDGHGNIPFKSDIVFIGNPNILIDKAQSIVFTNGVKTHVGFITVIPMQKESALLTKLKRELRELEEKKTQQPPIQGNETLIKQIEEKNKQILYEESKPKETTYLVTIYECGESGCILGAAEQGAAGQGSAGQGTAEQDSAGQGSAGQGSAGQGAGNGASTLGTKSVYTVVPGNAASVTTGAGQGGGKRRKTRKVSQNKHRKTYKQRGGNAPQTPQELGLPVGAKQFILYKNGMTSSLDSAGSISAESTKIPFNDRVKQILDGFRYEFSSEVNPYAPLGDIKSSVIARLKTISDVLKKQVTSAEECTSPAQYRAYILATQTEEGGRKLKMSFCNDLWANKQVLRIIPYALLDALYKDEIKDKMSYSSKIEYEKIINQFINYKIMIKETETEDEITFKSVKFNDAKNVLPAVCMNSPTSTDNTLFIETLMESHKAIRDLYDTHIQAVIQFITSKLISPKFRGYREAPHWTMNPIFSTDSRGALTTLESIIREGRTMLVKHYFAVESIYIRTLEKLREMGSGLADLPANPLSPNPLQPQLSQAPSSLAQNA